MSGAESRWYYNHECAKHGLPTVARLRRFVSHGLGGAAANHHFNILSSALKSARPTKYRCANIKGIQNSSSAHICLRGIGGSSAGSSMGARLTVAKGFPWESKSSWMENHCGRISSDLVYGPHQKRMAGISDMHRLCDCAAIFICPKDIYVEGGFNPIHDEKQGAALLQRRLDARFFLRITLIG